MKATKTIVLMACVLLVAACGKDDGPPVPGPGADPQNKAPNSFSLLAPEIDEAGASRNPTFSWEQATDPDGDAVTYDLFVDKEDEPVTLVASGLSTTTFTLEANLDLDTEYHWKVLAKDAKDAIRSSNVGLFTTEYPIRFLKEYTSMFEDTSTLAFSYANGRLQTLADRLGNKWTSQYDMAQAKLSGLTKDIGGGTITYSYDYTTSAKQNKAAYSVVGQSEIWALEYDEQDRLKTVGYFMAFITVSSQQSKSTFEYPDDTTDKPTTIVTEESGSNPVGSFSFKAKSTLEWEGENIVSIVNEVDNDNGGYQFQDRIEYTYDDNINPYYTIIKAQFGWDNFFVANVQTQLETINFGHFYWQSSNNILNMHRFDDPNATEPLATDDYSYTSYTDDYYPAMASKTFAQGDVQTSQLSWRY